MKTVKKKATVEQEVALGLLKIAQTLVSESETKVLMKKAAEKSREDKVEDLVKELKKLKGITRVESEDWGKINDNDPTIDITLYGDNDEISLEVDKSGEVIWRDFSHTTLVGNLDKPKDIAKKMKEGFDIMDKNRDEKGNWSKPVYDWFRENKA